MSGIYIPGMEMPTSCMLCSFCVEEADPANGEMCLVTGKLMAPCNHERLDDCPLVPVPEHGRLIDADALIVKITDAAKAQPEIADVYYEEAPEIGGWLYSMPTIIPAEEGEE